MVIQIINPLRGIQAPETSETATNETDLRQLHTYRFCEWNPTGSDISNMVNVMQSVLVWLWNCQI